MSENTRILKFDITMSLYFKGCAGIRDICQAIENRLTYDDSTRFDGIWIHKIERKETTTQKEFYQGECYNHE